MYTKRQTVWLVSMLSLMVVLSAYYLFTEDVKELGPDVPQVTLNEVKVDATDMSKHMAEQAIKEASGKQTAATQGGKEAATQGQKEVSKAQTDAEVLKQMTAAAAGREYFDSMHMKKVEDLSKQFEQWVKIASDSKVKQEDSTKAQEEIYRLTELEAKLTNIEDLLMKDFANAIVLPDNNQYKVIVQASKLEKSQAVSIVDLVMSEMQVGPEKISVQYVR
jgi:stage III sporulation protein AH